MMSLSHVYLLDPSTKLSAHSFKSWIVSADESGHVHMVAVNADRNVARKNCRVLWHDLGGSVSAPMSYAVRHTWPIPGRGSSS